MTGPEVTAAMKAEDVDAGLVARAEAAREDALRKWHIKFRAGQQTEPGHVLGMRAALAAVMPEIQAQAWEPVTEWANEWTRYLDGLGELTDFGKGMKAAVDQITRLRAARLTATTEEPTT